MASKTPMLLSDLSVVTAACRDVFAEDCRGNRMSTRKERTFIRCSRLNAQRWFAGSPVFMFFRDRTYNSLERQIDSMAIVGEGK